MKTIRIIAVSVVKNENDVIESFCRYIATYCDRLIIHDDNSTDNTKNIIMSLIEEGLPITMLDEYIVPQYEEFRIPSVTIINILTKFAFDTFNADLVIPADADEFLTCSDGHSPRKVLERLENSIEYRMMWRTYICDSILSHNESFMPNSFTSYRNPELENFCKTMMSRQLYETYHCSFQAGYHTIVYADDKKAPEICFLKDLHIAHYPIRSEGQLITKVINGWLSYVASPTRVKGNGFHWENIYNQIKRTEHVDKDTLTYVSMRYALKDADILPETLFAIQGSFRTEFLSEKIKLKYTDYSINRTSCWNRVLDNIENMIAFITNKQVELQSRCINSEHLADTLVNQNGELQSRIVSLSQELECIRKSRSWQMTKPLRMLAGFFSLLRYQYDGRRKGSEG